MLKFNDFYEEHKLNLLQIFTRSCAASSLTALFLYSIEKKNILGRKFSEREIIALQIYIYQKIWIAPGENTDIDKALKYTQQFYREELKVFERSKDYSGSFFDKSKDSGSSLCSIAKSEAYFIIGGFDTHTYLAFSNPDSNKIDLYDVAKRKEDKSFDSIEKLTVEGLFGNPCFPDYLIGVNMDKIDDAAILQEIEQANKNLEETLKLSYLPYFCSKPMFHDDNGGQRPGTDTYSFFAKLNLSREFCQAFVDYISRDPEIFDEVVTISNFLNWLTALSENADILIIYLLKNPEDFICLLENLNTVLEIARRFPKFIPDVFELINKFYSNWKMKPELKQDIKNIKALGIDFNLEVFTILVRCYQNNSYSNLMHILLDFCKLNLQITQEDFTHLAACDLAKLKFYEDFRFEFFGSDIFLCKIEILIALRFTPSQIVQSICLSHSFFLIDCLKDLLKANDLEHLWKIIDENFFRINYRKISFLILELGQIINDFLKPYSVTFSATDIFTLDKKTSELNSIKAAFEFVLAEKKAASMAPTLSK